MAYTERMYIHWNNLTKTCYKQNMICENCPNKLICSIKPWNINPYNIKNIKYAVLKTLENVGEPK